MDIDEPEHRLVLRHEHVKKSETVFNTVVLGTNFSHLLTLHLRGPRRLKKNRVTANAVHDNSSALRARSLGGVPTYDPWPTGSKCLSVHP